MSATDKGAKLRNACTGVRVEFQPWLGVSRALTREQTGRVAEEFGASTRAVRATKKILNSKAPALRRINSLKSQARAYWAAMTLPYPEDATRLIRTDQLGEFTKQMDEFRRQITEAADDLQALYADLKDAAKSDLGELYSEADYPPDVKTQFGMEVSMPSLSPPPYLEQLHPELYAQQQRLIEARFQEAAQMAEAAFRQQFAELVATLVEKLKGGGDGQKKSVRVENVRNLQEFFGSFRAMNITGDAELEALIAKAEAAVKGIDAEGLRSDAALAGKVGEQLGEVTKAIDGMLVNAPRRRILMDQPKPASVEPDKSNQAA